MPAPLSVIFLGDCMLGRGVSRALATRGAEWFWGDALGLVRNADAAFVNLESPITQHPVRHFWKFFHFRALPETVGILKAGGVRFVSLANNHILDFGQRGLADTLTALDREGIAHAGAGMTASEAASPADQGCGRACRHSGRDLPRIAVCWC